jgi:hypothetical protein
LAVVFRGWEQILTIDFARVRPFPPNSQVARAFQRVGLERTFSRNITRRKARAALVAAAAVGKARDSDRLQQKPLNSSLSFPRRAKLI